MLLTRLIRLAGNIVDLHRVPDVTFVNGHMELKTALVPVSTFMWLNSFLETIVTISSPDQPKM